MMRTGWVVTGAAVAALALGACGTEQAPNGPGGAGSTAVTPRGELRPVTDQAVAADGGLECPTSVKDAEGMAVPQKPQGVDGQARLLPEREPTSLVVCSYPVLDMMTGSLKAPFALKERTLATAAQRAEVVEWLSWAPRDNGSSKACTAMGGDETVHLVGARYGTGPEAVVWVAAKADPNSCSKSTNGDFVSSAAMGVQLDRIVGGSTPAAPPPVEACSYWGFGRLGDDRSLAPEGDPVVTVCRIRADGQSVPSRLTAEQSREVVAALRGLVTRPSESSCTNTSDDFSRSFRLVLSYDEGPSVWVNVSPSCTPPVFGGGLQAADAGDVVDLVEQWSKPIAGFDPNGSVSSDGDSSSGDSGGGASGIRPSDGVVPPDHPQSVPPASGGAGVPGAPGAPGVIEPSGSTGD